MRKFVAMVCPIVGHGHFVFKFVIFFSVCFFGMFFRGYFLCTSRMGPSPHFRSFQKCHDMHKKHMNFPIYGSAEAAPVRNLMGLGTASAITKVTPGDSYPIMMPDDAR